MVKKLNRGELLSHIVEDDKLFELKKLIDKLEIVLNKHTVVSTDFLDPYEIKLSKSILNRFYEVSYLVDGGYEGSERSIIYMFPSYTSNIKKDNIKRLSLKSKNSNHRNVLGSVLSLGIDRRKIGDILISDFVNIFVKTEISDFIEFNLEKIGSSNVKFINTDFIMPENHYEERKIIITSLRLDSFLSAALKISRSKITQVIEGGYVKVNFKSELKTSFTVEEGDVLSVKGFGRIIFDHIDGKSRKGKFIIMIKIPK